MTKQKFIEQILKINNDLSGQDIEIISEAFEFAKEAHKGQKRANGDSYFAGHCIPVSIHVAEIGMDKTLICAALLHDTIEDTNVNINEIEERFGKDIAKLVEGVSKLGKLKYQGNERHVESLRKFFVSIAQDVRVVILKLADRWHNLETLQYLPAEKQQRIALESIMIYAPLASRLGMGKLVTIINDLAFPFAYPNEYDRTKKIMSVQLKKADDSIKKIYRSISSELYQHFGYSPLINNRVKGLYSLYKKLERKNWIIDEVFDLIAIRVVLESVADCYQALGIIHNKWRPVPGRVKDYIAVPKPNGYQSLHTAIFTGDGMIVEIQIRTKEMHEFNESGVASHHSYKNNHLQKGSNKESFAWIEQLREFQDKDLLPTTYYKRLRTDFFQDRIFVFTPRGDVIDLPNGGSILDFAYAVHSDIGNHATGGKINGKYVGLKTTLNSGDIAEIITNKKSKPSDKWLEYCVTSSAIGKIRRHLKIEAKDLK
jgi:guanosine-3',5'-bis(diphosphate) 3'-pyrophosphohydrolase